MVLYTVFFVVLPFWFVLYLWKNKRNQKYWKGKKEQARYWYKDSKAIFIYSCVKIKSSISTNFLLVILLDIAIPIVSLYILHGSL